jgi:Flp pilus assembly protein TadD
MVRLTAAQRRAVQALRMQLALDQAAPANYETWEGWGVMLTEYGNRVEDGQARIYYRTALALEKKRVVELDYQYGRVRLTPEWVVA